MGIVQLAATSIVSIKVVALTALLLKVQASQYN